MTYKLINFICNQQNTNNQYKNYVNFKHDGLKLILRGRQREKRGGGGSHETCHGVGPILRTITQLIFTCLNLTSFYQLKKIMVSDHWLCHYGTDNQAHLIMPAGVW